MSERYQIDICAHEGGFYAALHDTESGQWVRCTTHDRPTREQALRDGEALREQFEQEQERAS